LTEDTRVDLRYLPALDGLRAVAVAAVIAFHLEYTWARGGFLGVDLFFVLSGFLITSLLVTEWHVKGKVNLPGFWGRRARRLLPALLVLLAVISIYMAVGNPPLDKTAVRGDALSTLFYSANWHAIFAKEPYFTAFTAPSPYLHTWTLAIEEQFYVLWPLMVTGLFGFALTRRRPGRARSSAKRRGLVISLVLAAASAIEMALLYTPGDGLSRVYRGTDTRAFELLIGAALAFYLLDRPEPRGRAAKAWSAAGIGASAIILWSFNAATLTSEWLFRGGMVAGAVVVAVLIASVARPHPGPVGAVLSLRPIRFIGRISYGLYLWHWPVILFVNGSTTGVDGVALLFLRLGLTLAVTCASYYLIELPIRRGRPAGWVRKALAPTGVAVTGAVIVMATLPAAAQAAPVGSLAFTSAKAAPPPTQTTGTEHPAPIPLPAGRDPSASDPLRVMIVGDSVMHDAEPGVAAALEATGVVSVEDHSFVGFGLTHTPSWRTDWPSIIRREHPEVVIAMWSWDDELAESDPVGYAGLLDQALGTLMAPGNGVDGVAFLQFPKAGVPQNVTETAARATVSAKRERGREAWNAVVAGMTTVWPGRVMFLPVAQSLEVNGHYSTWLPGTKGWVRARKLDEVHMCPAGAATFGVAVVNQLTPVFHLSPMAPGWVTGSWSTDPRFNDPPGACPDDQPPAGYVPSGS
jgi:peptidoglycan/LPS O-acetylase OafA/YrhL